MPTGAADEFHYSRDGQPAGPVSRRVLMQMIQTGKLRASDLIYDSDGKTWRPVFEHPAIVDTNDHAAPEPKAVNSTSASAPVAGASVLPGQYAVYKPFKPKQSFEGKARTAMMCGMIGIVILPLGLFAAYIGADALAGMNRSGNQTGRTDAMTGLILGIAELVAVVGLSIWWSTQYSFIDLVNR